MSRNTFPYPEGVPEKPADIASDVVASGEWDRICADLLSRRALSPMWGLIIEATSASYSSLIQLGQEMEAHGRIEELAELCADTLETYKFACVQCGVEPHPSVRLRALSPREKEGAR